MGNFIGNSEFDKVLLEYKQNPLSPVKCDNAEVNEMEDDKFDVSGKKSDENNLTDNVKSVQHIVKLNESLDQKTNIKKVGRGRPSKTLKKDDYIENAVSDSENKDSVVSDDNNDDKDSEYNNETVKKKKKIPKKTSKENIGRKKVRGRPKKSLKEDDYNENEIENAVSDSENKDGAVSDDKYSDYNNNESTKQKKSSKKTTKENIGRKKGRGRPKKSLKEDDYNENEIENVVSDSEIKNSAVSDDNNEDKDSDYNNESTKQKKSSKETSKANIGTKKGRGRPSKTLKEGDYDENNVENAVSDSENKDRAVSDDNESTEQMKSPKRAFKANIGTKKGRGRPSKTLIEDDSDVNEVENAVSVSENKDRAVSDDNESTEQMKSPRKIFKANICTKKGRGRPSKTLIEDDSDENEVENAVSDSVNKDRAVSDDNESTEQMKSPKKAFKANIGTKKGRGRPSKTLIEEDYNENEVENAVSDSENKDSAASDDNDKDSDYNDESTKQKKSPKKTSKENIGIKKGRGRPRKSLKEDDYDENKIENAVSDSEYKDSAASDDNNESTKQTKSPKRTSKENIGIRKGRGRPCKTVKEDAYKEIENSFWDSENKDSVFSDDKDSDYSNESTKPKKRPKRASEESIGIKRGRGRPKKIPKIDSEVSDDNYDKDSDLNYEANKQKNIPKRKYEESIGIKRGRGRPKKILKIEETEDSKNRDSEDNYDDKHSDFNHGITKQKRRSGKKSEESIDYNENEGSFSDSEIKNSIISDYNYDDKHINFDHEITKQKGRPKLKSVLGNSTKRRGRPKKSAVSNDDSRNMDFEVEENISDAMEGSNDGSISKLDEEVDLSDSMNEVKDAKRGRGRPKGNTLKSLKSTSFEKRGRGRPKSNLLVKDLTGVGEVNKKGRGRPKKSSDDMMTNVEEIENNGDGRTAELIGNTEYPYESEIVVSKEEQERKSDSDSIICDKEMDVSKECNAETSFEENEEEGKENLKDQSSQNIENCLYEKGDVNSSSKDKGDGINNELNAEFGTET